MSGRIFLWLLPSASVQDRFATLIDTLSRRHGTPRFAPHITLTGSLDSPADEISLRTSDLAARLRPVPVQLTEVGWSDEYFRCLFIRAAASPELLAAHRTACAHLGRSPDTDFMPHLSLIYGNLSQDQKDRIVDEIGRRFDIGFDADRVGLCLAAGSPEQWRLIRTFALAGRRAQDISP